jgi:hypothetical protein
MNLNVFTMAGNKNFEYVIKAKDGYLASDSYMVVLAKNYNSGFVENKSLESKFIGIINTAFSDSSKDEYKLSDITEKEDLVECGCCHGSGYEKQCPCGVSTSNYLFSGIVNGFREEEYQCIHCEDTGVIAATSKEDDGAYTCASCNGTGKMVVGTFEGSYKKVGFSHVSDENLQKIYHYLGDATFYPTKNPLSPIYFDGEGFEGVVMPMVQKEEKKEKPWRKS